MLGGRVDVKSTNSITKFRHVLKGSNLNRRVTKSNNEAGIANRTNKILVIATQECP